MHASSGGPAGPSTGPGQATPGSWAERRPSSALTPGRPGARRGRGAGLAIALLSAVAFGGSGVAAKPL
ncbi:EamA family transporter, partial [Streptomyces lydicus]